MEKSEEDLLTRSVEGKSNVKLKITEVLHLCEESFLCKVCINEGKKNFFSDPNHSLLNSKLRVWDLGPATLGHKPWLCNLPAV